MEKLAVITGATRGIGNAIAKGFAAEGMIIVACARNTEQLTTLKKEIESGFAVACHVFKADLSIKSEVFAFVDFIKNITGELTVLVNNTGIFIPGEVHKEDNGVLEKTIETNVYSAYYLTRGLVSDMMAQNRGHIFNICSTASITAYQNGGSYCISKFALLGMTKVLREEMKPHGIRVTAVLPGATFTSSWEGVELPEERFMKAEDVAGVVISAYKLSQQAVVEEIVLRPLLGDL